MSTRSAFLLAIALVAGACSHPAAPVTRASVLSDVDESRRELRAIIADPVRAARADALVLRLRDAFDEAAVQAEASRKQIHALDARHDATEQEFQALLAEGDAAREEQRRVALEVRDQLARLLTPEEWKQSAVARRRLLELKLTPQPL